VSQTRNLILAVLSIVAVIASTSACNKETRVIVTEYEKIVAESNAIAVVESVAVQYHPAMDFS
jgi:hypothetical protein